ncbi:MAG: GntR family transcriptional regulator [Pseudomonadota bacterium]
MAPKFEPLKKEPAYVKVYNAVEANILSGAIPEGAPLPTEVELCEQFGITRATVREGLRLLEQADLVQRGAGKRFYVKRPDAEDVATATSKSLALGGATFREVWEALVVMYPPAVRLAANKFTAEDIEKLVDNHRAFDTIDADDTHAIVEGAVGFFQLIAGGLENRVLLAMLQSLNMMIRESLNRVIIKTPKAKARILDAQARIIGAIEAGDENEAAEWIARHIDDLKRGYDVANMDLENPIL